MDKTLLIPALLLVSLSACAQAPVASKDALAGEPSGPALVAPSVSQLTPQLMYQVLLGEIAGQRGELRLSAETYADLLERTRDERVARRATEVALYARQPKLALRNAQIWLQLAPHSEKALQTMVSLMIGTGQLREAVPYLQTWLKQGKPEQIFMQLHALLARQADKKAASAVVVEVAEKYPELPAAHFAVAQSGWQAGQVALALHEIDVALRLSPGWENAALFKAQVLQQKESEAAALAYLADFLRENPASQDVRMAYAKQLAKSGRLSEARGVFETLTKEMPQNSAPVFALGLVSMQAGEFESAQRYFLKAQELGYPEENVLRFYLAQMAEELGHHDEALEWFKSVAGSQRFEAQLHVALILSKQARLAEARAWLAEMPLTRDVQRVRVAQTEAQILRDAKSYVEAFAVLDQAVARYPSSVELLYDRAMAAERLGRLDVLEQDLRKIIQIKPDHAHAYNALGYTLADRTARQAEAISLLEKAISLAPDDPFILDSLGWAMFKAKRYGEAEVFLRRAYADRQDPDIAAHLGEVLWMTGAKEEAQQILRGGLGAHPDNEVLRETLSRLVP